MEKISGNNPSEKSEYFDPYTIILKRKESSEALNIVCTQYYTGEISLDTCLNNIGISPEDYKIAGFVIDAFSEKHTNKDKIRRKDGKYTVTHSLQLYLTAKNTYGISDPETLHTLLLHDVLEDTNMSYEDMVDALGEEKAKLSVMMTEERNPDISREQAVMVFADQIISNGNTAMIAEVIDRIDDMSDISYLLTDLTNSEISDDEKETVKKKLLKKFAKCIYMINTIKGEIDDIYGVLKSFDSIVTYQMEKLETSHGIYISAEEVSEEIHQSYRKDQ